jgi:hypothetical protein
MRGILIGETEAEDADDEAAEKEKRTSTQFELAACVLGIIVQVCSIHPIVPYIGMHHVT